MGTQQTHAVIPVTFHDFPKLPANLQTKIRQKAMLNILEEGLLEDRRVSLGKLAVVDKRWQVDVERVNFNRICVKVMSKSEENK